MWACEWIHSLWQTWREDQPWAQVQQLNQDYSSWLAQARAGIRAAG